LTTKRLVLRPFSPSDARDVQLLAGDRSIADTTLTIPHPYEDGAAEEWISGHQEIYDRGKGVTFAVTTKEDGVLVGAISLMSVSAGHQAELGYWVGKPFWNRGFCTEAAEAVLQYAFEEMGLERVHACHLSRNPPSGRVMQKIGMRNEGCRRHHVRKWGVLEDLELYGILRQTWKDRTPSST
jgi:RimJ/RimL family protein N-acetyltransferase